MRKKLADQRATRLHVIVTSPTAACTDDVRPPRLSLLADVSTSSNCWSRYTSADRSVVECQRSTWPSASLTRRNFGRFGEVDDEVDEFDVAAWLAAVAAVAVAAADADDCERASRGSNVDKYLI